MAVRVEVVYALPQRQEVRTVKLGPGASVLDAVRASGLLERHPEIDLRQWRLGIYGRVVDPGAPVAPGDRIEIYRPLAADPKEVRRRRALKR